jgi:hypothetical protein
MTEADLLSMRIRAIGEGATRSRLAFFIMLFASASILIAVFDNYFAWNRIKLASNMGLSVSPPSKAPNGDKLKQEMDAQTVRNMADYQDITVSWLGIKFSSSDEDVLGSLALFFTSMYYLLCIRRVSLETQSLIQEVSPSPPVAAVSGSRSPDGRLSEELLRRRAVYFGVRQSYVLNSAIDEKLASRLGSTERSNEQHPDFGLRLLGHLFPILTFLPLLTVLLCLVSDWYYVLVQNSEDYGSGWWWFTHLTPEFLAQFIVMEMIAVVLGVFIWRMNQTTYQFEKQTMRVVNSFAATLEGAGEASCR